MIEKLDYKIQPKNTMFGSYNEYVEPNNEELMDKINEIIDAINRIENKQS